MTADPSAGSAARGGMELPTPESWQHRVEETLPSEHEIERYFDRLWPINRSLSGEGFRESLAILSEIAPLETFEVPTGTRVLDWIVPKEWAIEAAYLESGSGDRLIDFADNNLHVVGYSTPVDDVLTYEELAPHLHTLPEQPDAIPYLTSYYEDNWGFCMSENQRRRLPRDATYHAVIKSNLFDGAITLAHRLLPPPNLEPAGEILLSTYLCHPSMANNELSGPLVTAFVNRALGHFDFLRYCYRTVIVPETIGSIAYLDRFGEDLISSVQAGLVVTCVGDDRALTYRRSRRGNALVDRVAIAELRRTDQPLEILEFSPSGSDERQYCSPGFNLPVGSIMRSSPGTYLEYHTSLDNKSLISFAALRESVALCVRTLLALEFNRTYLTTIARGEPMLGRRGLYPSLGGQKEVDPSVMRMMWLINLSDGQNDLCAIAARAGCSILDLEPIARLLVKHGILDEAA